jgi:hypothetical protein
MHQVMSTIPNTVKAQKRGRKNENKTVASKQMPDRETNILKHGKHTLGDSLDRNINGHINKPYAKDAIGQNKNDYIQKRNGRREGVAGSYLQNIGMLFLVSADARHFVMIVGAAYRTVHSAWRKIPGISATSVSER